MNKEKLIQDLQSTDWYTATEAAKELQNFTDSEVVTALTNAMLQKEDLWVASAAAEALLHISDPNTVSAFFQVLTSTSLEEELKQAADDAKSKGDYRGIVALAEHFGGEIFSLKLTAAQALVKIGTKEALEALEQANTAADPYGIIAKVIEKAKKEYGSNI